MKDHFAARMLSDLCEADGLTDMDFGDFVALSAEAAADPEGLFGGVAPAGYDPGAAYVSLIGARILHDMQEVSDRVSGYFAERDDARHASARRGIMAANGASDADYDAALAANAAGDPSPLLSMRTKYLDTI